MLDTDLNPSFIVRIDPDLRDLIPGYLNNRKSDIETMAQKCAQGDFEAVSAIAHKIKGTGGGYGFDRITHIGGRIEDSAKADDAEGIRAALSDLADYISRVRILYE